jgi:hypothetical protein
LDISFKDDVTVILQLLDASFMGGRGQSADLYLANYNKEQSLLIGHNGENIPW